MTVAAYFYRAYGLTILSEFRLDEAEPTEPAEPDIRIFAADLTHLERPFEGFRDFVAMSDGDFFNYRTVGRFFAARGEGIAVDPDVAFDVRLLGLVVLGPVMAVLLHRRGYHVLHGSAVEIDGEAAVFLGDKGAGKSTTAAALVAAGHRLIADDVVAIRTDTVLDVPAGYQVMKLQPTMRGRFRPDAGHVLEPCSEKFTADKIRFRLARSNPPQRPLGRLHVLARGSVNALAVYDRPATLKALIRFSYFPRLGDAALRDGEAAALFFRAAALASRVSAGLLTVKHDLDALPELASFLCRDRAPNYAFD